MAYDYHPQNQARQKYCNGPLVMTADEAIYNTDPAVEWNISLGSS